MEHGKCRSCQANIIWVKSAKTHNLMPIDAEPVAGGNVAIKDDLAHIISGDLFEEMMDGPRYVSHFATCPNAEKYRKKK